MDKRFVTFLVLSFAVLVANMWLMRWLAPPPPPAAPPAAAQAADDAADAGGDKPPAPADAAAPPAAAQVAEAPAAAAVDQPPAQAPTEVAPQWITLGSADPDGEFRMLVTLVNAGAAVERIELSSLNYLDQEDRSGYLGQLGLVPLEAGPGCRVRVVGPGTPAALAGLRPEDIIESLNDQPVADPIAFDELRATTQPGQEFTLGVRREGKLLRLSGTFRRRPMEVIQPEGLDPLSFLLTMESIDERKIARDGVEIDGLQMRTSNWQVLPQGDPAAVSFQYDLPAYGLQVVKTFRLVKAAGADVDRAYHLEFGVTIRNVGDRPRKVAYRLDGPTGLPLEGAWYAYKISPNWRGGAGMRDVVVAFLRDGVVRNSLVSCYTIATEKSITPWQDEPIKYIGVDAQYFACALLPQTDDPTELRYARSLPILAGPVPDDKSRINRANVSFRMISLPVQVDPGGPPLAHQSLIFAGPKRPSLLAGYGLDRLVYYGMFGWVAEPMLAVLHFFHSIIPNYGVAIIMLTVLVRSLMFPLSRKQALNAQKMQELQPEIKRLAEKYKGNVEARSKAQQELFRKHNYNPLSGCLPVFLQLPIFIGLYRSLSVDVELRGAPLISSSIRWCSNLAAPDMLWRWQEHLPAFLAADSGWLGPYFNLLPCITIGLFIWQQKMFMPPPADEQAAMQQKIMQYMMIFIGVMFFKVASGLCLYFIASSLWGITERKLLPKAQAPATSPAAAAARPALARPGGNGNGSSGSKSKPRGRK